MSDSGSCPAGGHHAVLLAAGAGRRFGGRKLLASWRGEPLVRWSARTALAAPVELCLVVTGSDASLVVAAMRDLAGSRLRFAREVDWDQGLSASVQRGIEALPANSRAVVVLLGDMPCVPPGQAGLLLAAIEAGAAAAETVLGGKRAHPVAFSRALYGDLRTLTGDQGGRGLLRGRTDVARLATSDPGSAFDVDRPDDLRGPSAR